MQLTKEQIDQAVADAMPNVLAGLRREIETTAINEAREIVRKEVGAIVTKWVTENVGPQIIETLTEGKEGFVRSADAIAEAMVTTLAKAMREAVVEKMENSWDRRKVFAALFE